MSARRAILDTLRTARSAIASRPLEALSAFLRAETLIRDRRPLGWRVWLRLVTRERHAFVGRTLTETTRGAHTTLDDMRAQIRLERHRPRA